jgi:hypothetical protein
MGCLKNKSHAARGDSLLAIVPSNLKIGKSWRGCFLGGRNEEPYDNFF